MKEIYKFDEANYDNIFKQNKRNAARGIIFINDKLLMINSKKYNEYKFPGGGQENNESYIDTLKREVLEETGYEVIEESIKEFGYISEIRKSIYDEDEMFEMNSYYYTCSVSLDNISEPNYSDIEKEAGYKRVLIKPTDAYLNNTLRIEEIGDRAVWIKRENIILDLIIKKITAKK